MVELRSEPEQFTGRIIFMSMYNDIVWRKSANSVNLAEYGEKLPQGCWSFLGPGCEKKWYGTHVNMMFKAGILYFVPPVPVLQKEENSISQKDHLHVNVQ